jgi:NADH-quinone oxidoreductase subunit H
MTESLPLWVHILRVVASFGLFLLLTAMLIWAERRLVSFMQSRIGPNRVGPLGILQTLVDGIKMFFKEDVTPGMVDKPVYALAPLLTVIVGFLSIAIIPIGGEVSLFGETFTLQAADLNVGVLWFLAMGSIHVYGVVLAGWASQSPYPLMGGVRSSAQMISYEIAQGLAVASVFIYTGSLQVSQIVGAQANEPGLIAGMPNWYLVPLFPAFLVFAIGMVAEAGRPPFDLAEAEGELVAGFHTEYSGMRFGMFMLAEFMNVVTMSAIMVTLFFGGPSGPVFGPDWFSWILPIVWFLAKTSVFIFIFVLLRAALPRMRYDKLMDLGWKVLIPVGLVWTLVTAALVLVNEQGTNNARVGIIAGAAVVVIALLAMPAGRSSERPTGPVVSTARRDDVDDDARLSNPIEEVNA